MTLDTNAVLIGVGALTALAFLLRPGRRLFVKLRRLALALASSRLAVLWVFILHLGSSLGLATVLHLPVPRCHDEFSYLLQADTFAHGRLSNPAHPSWRHFESFHVLQQPTYASKYPPGQGAALALGQVIWRPILGVWISSALAAAAVFWLLAALVPRAWALAGTLLVSCNPQWLEWNWSFWGGSLALLGGALLFGGLLRLCAGPRASHAGWMGCGLALLALTRPFEGFVLALLALALLAWSWRRGLAPRRLVAGFLVPAGVPVLAALAFQAFYDARVTGDPWTLPYSVYERAYSRVPLFLCLEKDAAPIAYGNEEMAEFYRIHEQAFDFQQSVRGYFYALRSKLLQYQKLFWGWVFFPIVLLALPRLVRSSVARSSLLLLSAFAAVMLLLPTYSIPHYAAPALPLLALLFVLALRRLGALSASRVRYGRWFVRGSVALLCAAALLPFIRTRLRTEPLTGWEHERAALEAQVRAEPGEHLLLVKYAPGHVTHFEWVYNGADLERAPVVWARDLGERENRALLEHYPNRTVLTITVDNLQRPR
ncbi:MAG: hypothetical protein HOP15_14370 [Planctomycetes bacterium]|nr:hypothetical protein [Planctomycetota bacterium]